MALEALVVGGARHSWSRRATFVGSLRYIKVKPLAERKAHKKVHKWKRRLKRRSKGMDDQAHNQADPHDQAVHGAGALGLHGCGEYAEVDFHDCEDGGWDGPEGALWEIYSAPEAKNTKQEIEEHVDDTADVDDTFNHQLNVGTGSECKTDVDDTADVDGAFNHQLDVGTGSEDMTEVNDTTDANDIFLHHGAVDTNTQDIGKVTEEIGDEEEPALRGGGAPSNSMDTFLKALSGLMQSYSEAGSAGAGTTPARPGGRWRTRRQQQKQEGLDELIARLRKMLDDAAKAKWTMERLVNGLTEAVAQAKQKQAQPAGAQAQQEPRGKPAGKGLSRLAWTKGQVLLGPKAFEALMDAEDPAQAANKVKAIVAKPGQVNEILDLARSYAITHKIGVVFAKEVDGVKSQLKWLRVEGQAGRGDKLKSLHVAPVAAAGLPLELAGEKVKASKGSKAAEDAAAKQTTVMRITMVKKYMTDSAWRASPAGDDICRSCFVTVQEDKVLDLLRPDRAVPWEITGTPASWGANDVSTYFTENDWTEVSLIRPRFRNKGWIFRMKAPAEVRDYSVWQIHNHTITVVHDTWQQKGMTTKMINPRPGVVRQDLHEQEKERKAKADAAKPPGEQGGQAKKTKCINVYGYQGWDLGGKGDCLYRAAAASAAALEGRKKEDIEKNIASLGKKIRAETTGLIRKHSLFKGVWVADPNASVRWEGGPIPATYQEWVDATAREGRYACEHTAAVLALRLERRLVVFYWHQGKWVKGWVISPPEGAGNAAIEKKRSKAMGRAPIPVALKDEHYVALHLKDGQKEWPLEWADPPEEDFATQLLRGGVAATGSCWDSVSVAAHGGKRRRLRGKQTAPAPPALAGPPPGWDEPPPAPHAAPRPLVRGSAEWVEHKKYVKRRNRHVDREHPDKPRSFFNKKNGTLPTLKALSDEEWREALQLPMGPLPKMAWTCQDCGKSLPFQSDNSRSIIDKARRAHREAEHGVKWQTATEWRRRQRAAGRNYLPNGSLTQTQETSLSEKDFKSFRKSMFKHGYRAYHQGGNVAEGTTQQIHSVVTIVSRKLRSKQLWSRGGPEGQILATVVEGVVLFNTYVVPGVDEGAIMREISDVVQVDRLTSWMAIGDWNQLPTQVLVPRAWCCIEAVKDKNGDYLPTRWRGHRCIDYGVSWAMTVTGHELIEDAISDHIVVQMLVDFRMEGEEVEEWRLAKHRGVAMPPASSKEEWVDITSKLGDSTQGYYHVQSGMKAAADGVEPGSCEARRLVDQKWAELSHAMETCMAQARAMLTDTEWDCAAEDPERTGSDGRKKLKKNEFRLERVRHGRAASCLEATFRERQLANALARLRRLAYLQQRGAGREAEARRLREKAKRYLEQTGDTALAQIHAVQDKIVELEGLLRSERDRAKEQRLARWRESLRTSRRKAHSWLRGHIPPDTMIYEQDREEAPAQSMPESLGFLISRWRKVWDRELPPEAAWRAKVAEWGPRHQEEVWAPLEKEDVRTAQDKIRGSSAGPDGWTSEEVADAIFATEAVAEFFNLCETVAALPSGWQKERQAHLPKEDVAEGKALPAEAVRPISVSSCWYRLWAGSRLHSAASRQWQRRWWPERAFGAKRGASVNDAAGMPKAIVAMLTQQWENQERYMQLAGITHPQAQEVRTSLPQGDPWSPLALTCLLAGPLRELEERVPNVTTTVFVDDRTWTARRLEDLLAAAQLWRAWSAALGLKENALKEQWSHWDPAGRRNLQKHVSPDTVADKLEVLGMKITGGKRRKKCRKEVKRLDKASQQTAKAALLPLPPRERKEVVEAGPLASAQYGWVFNTPNIQTTNQIQSRVHRAIDFPIHAPRPLKLLILGHRSDVRYRCQQEAILGVVRAIAKGLAGNDPTGELPWKETTGWSGVLAKHLAWTGWRCVDEWVWNHQGTEKTITLRRDHPEWREPGQVAHLLREAWRFSNFQEFVKGSRRATVACDDAEYDPLRYKRMLKLVEEIPAAASLRRKEVDRQLVEWAVFVDRVIRDH
ncbi:unnamed protein product, partial [Prorocentrum cordatum]